MTTSEAHNLVLSLIDAHFEEQENILRKFKWIANVPQSGEEYTKNLNVFEIQDKAIEQLKEDRQFVKQLIK